MPTGTAACGRASTQSLGFLSASPYLLWSRPLNRVCESQERTPGSCARGELAKVPFAQVLGQTPPPDLDPDPFGGRRSAHATSAPMCPYQHCPPALRSASAGLWPDGERRFQMDDMPDPAAGPPGTLGWNWRVLFRSVSGLGYAADACFLLVRLARAGLLADLARADFALTAAAVALGRPRLTGLAPLVSSATCRLHRSLTRRRLPAWMVTLWVAGSPQTSQTRIVFSAIDRSFHEAVQAGQTIMPVHTGLTHVSTDDMGS
jgi:hypothetical protein